MSEADQRSWIVTGATGMLGRDLVTVLTDAGMSVWPLSRADLDITDSDAVDSVIGSATTGTVVVNLAAWTDVDGAESQERRANDINAEGAYHVARACARAGARMIHLSTDYVFAGTASAPYAEDADPEPLNAYGRSKAAGERRVLETLPEDSVVIRTAWLYGRHGSSFVRTVLRLATERDHLDVVDDQVGQPTWTTDLARRILEVGSSPTAAGVFHGTNSGQTSWFGLARAVFEVRGLDPARVRPTTAERFPRPAPRPSYSVLGHDRWSEIGLAPMRPWRDALAAGLSVVAL